MNTDKTDKIQKTLAANGYGSRREIEDLIKLGKIIVDDKIAITGQRIHLDQIVKINNKVVNIKNNASEQIIIYNKPRGEICTKKDPLERQSVYDKIPKLTQGTRWVMVGRLDINSEGLLLFTTNGEYANYLMHPSNSLARIYKVRIHGDLTQNKITTLLNGVTLEDGIGKFDNIKEIGGSNQNTWHEITISSGKNRIIRRLIESQGLMVNRLIRVQYGPYKLPHSLKTGSSVTSILKKEIPGLA
jgi:23S rRNA pseudouridine2605 synthase